MILAELRANAWKWSAVVLAIGLMVAIMAGLVFRAKSIADASSAKFAKQEAQVLADELSSTREVLSQERTKARQLAVVATQYEQDKQNAEQTANRLRDQLRTGTVSLRPHWTCPSVPQAPAGSSEPDAAAELRAEGSGDLVHVGADCDAQVRRLQAVTQADRE